MNRLAHGEEAALVGPTGTKLAATPLEDVVGRSKPPDNGLLELAGILAR